ncbi:MAG: hypothetical protein KF884_03325 [Fimbriimonadaceae bacterium]|nr:hypothetical protein [Fimbriimonadaceae bacterium]QYK59740.1 MAG: hypothetical protein KF884_03325 [Fimbriimonadaceae bacterium]
MSVSRGMTRSRRKFGTGVVPPQGGLVLGINRWIVVVLDGGYEEGRRATSRSLREPTELTLDEFGRIVVNQVLSLPQADPNMDKFEDKFVSVA